MTKVKKRRAFTLTELLITVVILSLLIFIFYQSIGNYYKISRDARRISDLVDIQSSLEFKRFNLGYYPSPSSSFEVTYSGAKVWDQGEFDINVLKDSKTGSQVHKDPALGLNYTYSVTANKKQYQLATIQEEIDDGLNISVLNDSIAGEEQAKAYIIGNYNGKAKKVLSGSLCTVLSLPSIISGAMANENDLQTIIDDKKLVYNGYYNLPSNIYSTRFDTNGGFDFVAGKSILYSDNFKCRDLYNENDNTARKQLVENMQEAYSGTIIEKTTKIERMLHVDTTNNNSLDNYSLDFVEKRL